MEFVCVVRSYKKSTGNFNFGRSICVMLTIVGFLLSKFEHERNVSKFFDVAWKNMQKEVQDDTLFRNSILILLGEL